MNKKFNRLVSIRQKQAYGAICLAAFCKQFRADHVALIALIKHLFNILKVENLSDWELDGTKLELASFGDPLPEEVKKIFQSLFKVMPRN